MNHKFSIAGINFFSIINIFGKIFIVIGIFMIFPFIISLIYKENIAFLMFISAIIPVFVGVLCFFITKTKKTIEIKRRESFLLVSLSWFLISIFGAFPFVFTNQLGFIDAYFEVVSGYTTTGASILNNIEALPKSLLFWRSQTQWLGGMGIIVMFIAIFPLIKTSKMSLFTAEASVIVEEKVFPRFVDIARWIGFIYFLLTFILFLLLFFGEMDWFDSINHAFTTMSTGGYSTKNSSMSQFSAYSQYIVTLFMLLASISFSSYIYIFKKEGKKIFKNEEIKIYLLIILSTTLIATIFNVFSSNFQSIEEAFRHSIFQIISIISTTGFVTHDYTFWAYPAFFVVIFVMLTGGTSGSTAGGIKIGRFLLFVKNFFVYLKKLMHPDSVTPLKFNQKMVSENISNITMVFIITYFSIIIFSSIFLTFFGVDILTSLGAVISSLGNIGPAFGKVGPVDNFSHFSGFIKLFLAFLMILGRLEVFTVLIIFTVKFWKS